MLESMSGWMNVGQRCVEHESHRRELMSIPINLLKKVSNEQLMNYLMDKGWIENPVELTEVIELLFPVEHSILIPNVEHMVGNDCMMMVVISGIANIECRSIEDVFADILSSSVVMLCEVTDLVERVDILTDKYSDDDILQSVSDLLSELVCKIEDVINDGQS